MRFNLDKYLCNQKLVGYALGQMKMLFRKVYWNCFYHLQSANDETTVQIETLLWP